jgi:hypothetical protein
MCCGDHAHRNSPPSHKCTEGYDENSAVWPTAKTARQNPGIRIFSGMLTLDLDFGLNTNVEAQEIVHFLTKNEDFCYYGQRVTNFLVTLWCCLVFHQIDAMSFILHILLVYNVNKLVNMGLMKISWISDGGTNSCFP